jgi:hypothetical protein
MYVDQFGFERLLKFALRLDYVLGGIRVEKRSVFRETARNFFRDKPRNLLDVIAGAFIPDEVMEYLMQDQEADRQYRESDAVEVGKGVQGRYKQQVLCYYRCQGSLNGKREWIQKRLQEVTLA